jgi:hypothetical protein
MNSEMIEMSGCSVIDIDIARMFWKSFSLSPPIESKLYSPDIKQRRRTATASGRRAPRKKNEENVYDYNNSFYQNQGNEEENKRRDIIYEKRMETLSLHEKLRRLRLKKEEISARVKPGVLETLNIVEEKPEENSNKEEIFEVKNLNYFRSKSII